MIKRQLKKSLLFLLSNLADIYSEVSLATFYRRLYDPEYRPQSITETLSRLVKIGNIKKEIVVGEAVLKITSKGKKLLDEAIPLAKLAERKWDGVWRIVIFDISEKQKHIRNMVRKKLKKLGFGKWQKSVYLTPHSVTKEINEFFQVKNLFPRCVCLEASQTGIGDDKKLAAYVFKLNDLNKAYLDLKKEVGEITTQVKKKKLTKKEAFKKLRLFFGEYHNLILNDPFLPKELLPELWRRERTVPLHAKLSAGGSNCYPERLPNAIINTSRC